MSLRSAPVRNSCKHTRPHTHAEGGSGASVGGVVRSMLQDYAAS